MGVRWKKYLMVAGGFLTNTVNNKQVAGNIINLGTICPYIASYFHQYDPSITPSSFIIISIIANVSQAFNTIVVSYLFYLFSPIWTIVLGLTISCAGLFFSSYIGDPYLFCSVYGTAMGLMTSSLCLPAIWILWNQMPERKGRTSGLMLAGLSFGAVPFGILFTMLVNPYNYPPEITEVDNNETQKMFGSDVADNVPMTLRWTSLAYFLVGIIGVFLLPKKWNGDLKKNSDGQKLAFGDILRSWTFWNLFLMMFFGFSTWSFYMNVYKIVAMIHIDDDHFLAYTSSIGFFFSCLGRVFYGLIFDKYSWKKVMMLNYTIQIGITIAFDFTFVSRYLFALCFIIISFLQTSIYNGILLETKKSYPNDDWVFSYVCFALSFCFFVPYATENFITPEIGYFYTFVIISVITFVALILTVIYKEPSIQKSPLLD
jgi:MFS family permease